MAAGVVAQYAEVFGEGGNLCVPHVQVGAQGVGQHQHRRAGRAFEEVIQVAVGEFYGGHGKLQADCIRSLKSNGVQEQERPHPCPLPEGEGVVRCNVLSRRTIQSPLPLGEG
ncbi:hypothetical protein D3C78_1352210 [compost metagenome]